MLKLPLPSSRDRSVRRTWILSYLAILTVPLLVSLFVAFGTHKVLQDQIQDSSRLVVELLGKEIEGRLAYVLRLSNDVASHPLTNLVLEGPADNSDFRSDLASLADALAAQGSYNRYNDFFFLFLGRSRSVLLPRAYYTMNEFHQFHFEGTSTRPEDLESLLGGRRDNASIPLEYVDSTGRRRPVVAFLKSLPPQSSEPLGTVALFLDSASLVDSLHSVVRATGWELRIFDRDHRLLLSSLPDEPNRGVSYVSQWQTLPSLGWTAELLTPEHQIGERLVWVQAGTAAGLILSLVLGIGLTAYWLRRNYEPVSRILGELNRRTGAVSPPTQNEFLSIENGLIRAFEERYQALEKFERHKGLLSENLVSRMLHGASDLGQGWGPSLAALGMDWSGPEFLVVLAEGVEEEGAGTPRRERYRESLARLVGSRGSVWPSSALDEVLFVLNLAAGAGRSVVSDLHRDGLPFVPLFSEVVNGWASLPEALAQVRVVRDHRYSSSGAGILSFGELPADQAGRPYPLTAALEERFVNALRAGDDQAALEVLASFSGPGAQTLAPQAARCLVGDLEACFLKALPQHDLLSALEAISGRKTVEDSLQGLQALAVEVCARVRAQQALHHDKLRGEAAQRLAEKVRSALQARFRDPNLTLTGLAEDLGYSAAYLSRFFKESQEEGLMETLARTRLDHAKRLLRRSDSPLAFVALECGFTDVNTFIRTFKKFFGITPGKYRETVD